MHWHLTIAVSSEEKASLEKLIDEGFTVVTADHFEDKDALTIKALLIRILSAVHGQQ